ncbi:hypothetical protein D9M71_511840 [compost metagenome]
MPNDVIEISDEYHADLLAGQSKGKVITWGEDGYPALADPPPPDADVLAAIERQWRDECLLATDGVVSRHRDELEAGGTTTLTNAQYEALQAYRRALRDWPQVGEFPLIDHRPIEPQWLADLLQ